MIIIGADYMEDSSNISTWLPILFLWFIIFMQNKRKSQVKKIIKNHIEGVKPMEEIIKKYMGIPVVIDCIDNKDLTLPEGIITSYNDGWITLKNLKKDEETAINCNYIISIKPKKVKSKNK